QAGAPTSTVRGPGLPVEIASAPLRQSRNGGRSSYIPFVKPAMQKPSGVAITSPYWKLPLNSREILDEVKWAANGFSLEIKGPQSAIGEPQIQDAEDRLLVHLLNYDVERRPSVENVQISIRLPQGKSVASAGVRSPDTPASSTLRPAIKGDWATFT